MTLPHDQRDALLDKHLDSALTPHEREAFERELAADPAFAAEVALHDSISHGLRRALQPRAVALPPEITARIHAESAAANSAPPAPLPFIARAAQPRSPRRWLAIAALLALTFAGIWGMWLNFGPQTPPTVFVSAARIYEVQRARNFKPEWVCTTDKEFAKAVKDHVGQPLALAAAPNINVVGWAYPQEGYTGQEVALSRDTMILLTRVDGDDVIVLIDRAKHDRDIASPADPSLHTFKRTLGDLVLYEVTPRSEPTLLGRFTIPAAR